MTPSGEVAGSMSHRLGEQGWSAGPEEIPWLCGFAALRLCGFGCPNKMAAEVALRATLSLWRQSAAANSKERKKKQGREAVELALQKQGPQSTHETQTYEYQTQINETNIMKQP